MATRKQQKSKSIEVRFGRQHTGPKYKHIRKLSVVPTDTPDAIYERVRAAFQPHIGDSEIEVQHYRDGKRINLGYHGLVHGGVYQLRVVMERTHGPGHNNSATRKTKIAVDMVIRQWNVSDGRHHILPPSIAPTVPLQDNTVQGGDSQPTSVLDPYLWPTRFAEKLRSLSSNTQGSEKHSEVIQRLKSALEARLQRSEVDKTPELGVKCLKVQDIAAVIYSYNQERGAEKVEESGGVKQVIHRGLVLRSAAQHPEPDSMED